MKPGAEDSPANKPEPSTPADGPVLPKPGSRDPYGAQPGCMIFLGLIILVVASTYAFAPLALAAVLTAVLAWLLTTASPIRWKQKRGPFPLFLIFWASLLLLAIAGLLYLKYMMDSADHFQRM